MEVTSELMEKFDKYAKEPSKPVDVFPDFALLTLDAICRCAFGFVSKPPPPQESFLGGDFLGREGGGRVVVVAGFALCTLRHVLTSCASTALWCVCRYESGCQHNPAEKYSTAVSEISHFIVNVSANNSAGVDRHECV